jgi:hypothetical protein
VPAHLRRQYDEFARITDTLGAARRGDGAFPL